jgi:hypothetical protein
MTFSRHPFAFFCTLDRCGKHTRQLTVWRHIL